MKIRNIEYFFLNTVLKICIVGLLIIIGSNVLFYPEDTISISLSVAILAACCIAYLIRKKQPTLSVLILSIIVLAAMSYQRLVVPNTSTTLAVVLIVGFVFSTMLKGRIMWLMHGIAFIIINTIFVIQLPDAITAAITYSTLYIILSFAAGVLKNSYDRIHDNLSAQNIELADKANEIELKNKKLLEIQEDLNILNSNLEKIVDERTDKVKKQNELLVKYSYTNAHHLRGPVARLLGLAAISKIDNSIDAIDVIDKMVVQAHEIDAVVKQINVELESN